MTTKKKTLPYGLTKFSTIDEYHASFPTDIQKILQQLRQAIKQVAPQATETISYNIPTFKLNKKNLERVQKFHNAEQSILQITIEILAKRIKDAELRVVCS